ncbi:MAG: aminotransferase [Pseudomonadota bacterium]
MTQPAPHNRDLLRTFAPPVMEARRWVAEAHLPPDRPLLNFAQAAPTDPPPEGLRQALADAVLHTPDSHLYGPVLGLSELRSEVATQWSAAYDAAIDPARVGITAGCNQAFCAAIQSIAAAGDNVILPAPWYFNHRMWLAMQGIEARVLMCVGTMVPDPDAAAALVDNRTRAIVLVTPNNPTGAEYPSTVLGALYDLAQARGLALIVDETYRDFDSRSGAPHDLFHRDIEGEGDTLIHLYSFSKAYRLTGHRVGAVICHPDRLAQIEKFLDTVTICPGSLGQIGALWGMRNLGQWVAGERDEILARRDAVAQGIAALPGWRLAGAGAYFAYVAHPFGPPSDQIARRLVSEAGVLILPGTMFAPRADEGGDGSAERHLRIAFANGDVTAIGTLLERLSAWQP